MAYHVVHGSLCPTSTACPTVTGRPAAPNPCSTISPSMRMANRLNPTRQRPGSCPSGQKWDAVQRYVLG